MPCVRRVASSRRHVMPHGRHAVVTPCRELVESRRLVGASRRGRRAALSFQGRMILGHAFADRWPDEASRSASNAAARTAALGALDALDRAVSWRDDHDRAVSWRRGGVVSWQVSRAGAVRPTDGEHGRGMTWYDMV